MKNAFDGVNSILDTTEGEKVSVVVDIVIESLETKKQKTTKKSTSEIIKQEFSLESPY